MTIPTFSPSEAAFSVFELARRQPAFVARYCVATAVIMLVLGYLAAASGLGAKLAELQAMSATGKPLPPDRFAEWAAGIDQGAMLLYAALYLLSQTVLTAAALRKAVRDEEVGFGGLAFGRDEINLLVATLVVFALLVLGLTAGLVVVSLLGAATQSGALLAMVAIILLSVLIGGRLCQYGVLTIARERQAALESWAETGTVFWRFVGAHVLWFALFTTIALVLVSVVGALTGATGAPMDSAAYLSPGNLALQVFGGLLQGLGALGGVCVGAYAWHQMRASGG